MYEYDDDGEEGGRSTGRLIAAAAGVVVLALVAWFVIKPRLSDDGDAGGSVVPASADSVSAAAGTGSLATTTTDGGASGTADTTASAAGASTSDAPAAPAPAAATTVAPTTTVAPATTVAPPVASTTPAPAGPTYSTLPDGSPVPVLAVYSDDRVTLTGNVPDQAAKDLLGNLAVQTAKPAQAGLLVNDLTIDPSVPRNTGVRVVELTSARFPEGSAEITIEQAAEINRLATILNALPNLSALVIGHADQRGEESTNYVISEQRADAVVDYLVAQGIAPARLSSRAVGEADLLTLDNEPAALALNRRTEFVLFGLLAL